jgi:hypothetical protein
MIFCISINLFFDAESKLFEVAVKLAPGETERIANELMKIIKIGKQDFIESLFNVYNAVYYGSIVALFCAVSLLGMYGARIVGRFIEKKIYKSFRISSRVRIKSRPLYFIALVHKI